LIISRLSKHTDIFYSTLTNWNSRQHVFLVIGGKRRQTIICFVFFF